jgi:transcription initiation factor IIE alpha subunit
VYNRGHFIAKKARKGFSKEVIIKLRSDGLVKVMKSQERMYQALRRAWQSVF